MPAAWGVDDDKGLAWGGLQRGAVGALAATARDIARALLVAQAPALVAVALRVVCSSVADAERNAAEAQRVTAGESCGLFFLRKGCSQKGNQCSTAKVYSLCSCAMH